MPNVIFVLFGVSSDLAKKKLIPAIYNLVKDKKLKKFKIIGLASSEYTIDYLVNSSLPFIKKADPRVLNKILKNMVYLRGGFEDEQTYVNLKKEMGVEKRKNVLYYLSTSPNFFEPITLNLEKQGLNKEKRNWVRIVYEKPFGFSLKNAIDLNKNIKRAFNEEQIYRIDHYLGKELVQNVSILRFSNEILEPLWNKNYIDHVQIILDEEVGIGKRGRFYDEYGAVKDVIQNHVLQLLALIAMEAPNKFSAKHIRDEKYRLLTSVKSIDSKNVVLGQYEGYNKEEYMSPDSQTETFGAIKLFIDNERWDGVPFYVRAGKKLKDKRILIYIRFKNSTCNIFDICSNKKDNSNHLVIQIEPNKGYYLVVNSKTPGSNKLTPIRMNFSHGDTFKVNSPEAYEVLIDNVLNNDQSAFVRSDEIEESWRIIENVSMLKIKPIIYKNGIVPREAKLLLEKDDRAWFKETPLNK